MKSSLTIFFFLLINFALASGTTRIKGNAPEYINSEIIFYQLADHISEEKVELFRVKIDRDGNFQSEIELEKITHAFADFDSYSANIYLVPGKSYELIFPPLKKISDSERNNPFFKPIKVHLAIKNADTNELNRRIREFEIAYERVEGKLFNQIYRSKSKTAADSIQKKLTQEFPKSDNPFFENYKFYRLAFAEFALHQGKDQKFIRKYFNTNKINFQIEPCKNLFNRTYTNFFSRQVNTVNGGDFRKLLASSDPKLIENHLIKNHFLNSETSRLVILKSIHDAFHEGQFSQKNLLSLLNKIQSGNWSENQKKIAKRLEDKLKHLLPGTIAPPIAFSDFNGNKYSLASFKDKLIYLHFTRVANPICRQHLDALKKLPEAVQKEITIVNLILKEEASKQSLIKQQNWPGQFYIVGNNTIEEWKIKSYPTTFLISKDGTLIYSPAINPLDGFSRQIGNLLQKRHMQKLRDQAK